MSPIDAEMETENGNVNLIARQNEFLKGQPQQREGNAAYCELAGRVKHVLSDPHALLVC